MGIEELKALQDKIIEKNKKINKITILVVSIVIIGTIVFMILNKLYLINTILKLIMFGVPIGFIAVLLTKTIVNGKDIATFKREYKNIFVSTALKNTFENLEYNPETGLSENIIDNLGMIDTGDRFTSNDYVSGKYKNINFEQSDIEIEEKHEEKDEDGHTHTSWTTIFCGRWMIFDFNKKFKANVRVTSRGFYGQTLPSGGYSKVKMEDVEFNKIFNIYTNLEHDAFYILTPHFMEKIKNIYEKLNCGIMFCFADSKLHVAINNRNDSFEYDVLKKINEQEIYDNIIKDIKLITAFVDELNLDNNLFKEDN